MRGCFGRWGSKATVGAEKKRPGELTWAVIAERCGCRHVGGDEKLLVGLLRERCDGGGILPRRALDAFILRRAIVVPN